MPPRLFFAALLPALACAHAAGAPPAALSRPQLQSVLEFLASDALEGRAPGTAGARVAAEYLQSLFKLWDLEPGVPEGYLQPFAVRGVSVDRLELEAAGISLRRGEDVMGSFAGEGGEQSVEAEAVFVGFGIATDLWSWDDFKDVDVRGKLLVARVNDPGLFDPSIFEGKALTFFGRWTYHLEEAERRGAAGILLIHTDQTAGYGWATVQNSWGGESLSLEEEASASKLGFRGWIRESSLEKVLAAKGLKLDELYRASQSRAFRPVDLGFKIRASGRQTVRTFQAHNVVATIKGRSRQRVVISAHTDHLGKREGLEGDNIFNGAIDNASAVAAMALTARALASERDRLERSVTVLACDAEEAGLLGSRYYARHTDRESIVADVNFESTPVWEAAGSLMGLGARYSTLEDTVRAVAARQGLAYSEFSMTDQGFFFRSDQFSFARFGIPSVWISAGEDDRSGQRRYQAYWKTSYHTVKDEYDPAWPLEALAQTVASAVLLVEEIDRAPEPPRWRGKPPFPVQR